MIRRARVRRCLVFGLVVVLAAPAGPATRPASAQQDREPSLLLYEPLARPGFWSYPAPGEGGATAIDVRARFEAFQRELAADFGAPTEEEGGEEGSTKKNERQKRPGEALVERLEGTRLFHWYERMAGVYDRVERLGQRLEHSTRWATRDFQVDPDLEAAVDGRLRLAVERRVAGLDMGFKVDDAVNGRLGLRVGGVFQGYKFGVDVSDVVNEGRFSFQVRRITP